MSDLSKLNQLKIGFISLFFLVGLFISASVVSGDELGRVNLLHFIGLFVLWPFVSCLLLVVSSISSKAPSIEIIPWLLKLPVIPLAQKQSLLGLKKEQRLSPWLLLCSQQSVLAFSVGCLTSFFLVLLFSDVAFVWRSTLLSASNIEPVLNVIALPWSWFDAALPNIALIEATQENRMNDQAVQGQYGAWWLFLLMAQLVYSIIPRAISSLMASRQFKSLPAYLHELPTKAPINQQPKAPVLAKVSYDRPLLSDYNLCCWLQLPASLLDKLVESQSTEPSHVYHVGFHGEDEQVAVSDNRPQLLLVAAWEPPLGELKDYLSTGQGVIQLIDHKEGVMQPIASHYVDEWRRFCLTLDNWTLFIDKDVQ
ncbi:DUF2868 domain-containing protein [Psychrobium sp. nBUS_13]|uniref:DUF2868 domain-containing protein n=1 Tax=Psychrobium sp. nBUS_13 TaxID=3395319 RepID=UPI003EB84EC8